MTAEEFLVERYLKLEKKVADLEEVIDDKEELIDFKREEISEYEELVRVLSKYIKVSELGVNFYLSKNIEEDKADIEYLSSFFEINEVEEREEEQDEV
jgi:hypothetical protein